MFKLYDAWSHHDRGASDDSSADNSGAHDDGRGDNSRAEARRSVARGETIFNSRPIQITGVKGLNDDLGIPVLQGTCTTCHDTPAAAITRFRRRSTSA